MADMMTFPDTVEEFMEEYKLVDTEQVYTNGTELIPIFRMKQWFEHEKAQLSKEGATSDLISRTETVERLRGVLDVTVPITDYDGGYVDGVEVGVSTVSTMPPAQPEYEEVTPEEAVSEIASGSMMSAWSWFNVMIQIKQMGYAICRKR